MKQIKKAPLGIWMRALSDEICNKIIEEGLILTQESATVNQDRSVDSAIRDGKVGWFSKDYWIDQLLLPYVFRTNRLNEWNFNLNNSEGVQFTKYEKDDFYTWHRDCNVDSEIQRKISITVQLSDYDQYSGGEFEIKDCWGEEILNIPLGAKQKGSIVIFPSSLSHQVTPVSQGIRYSLVQWYSGPPFT